MTRFLVQRSFVVFLLLTTAVVAHCDDPSSHTALTLADAQRLLESRNIDLRLAQKALGAAAADVITAHERPNATASLNSASINPAAGIGSGPLWHKHADSIFRIDQPFERGGKSRHRVAAANAALDAAQADLFDSERQQRLMLAQAYYYLKRKQDRFAIAEEIVAIEKKSRDATDLRLNYGDVARLDVARLQIEAAQAENALTSAAADLREARITLAALLDLAPHTEQLQAIDDWPEPPAKTDAAPAYDLSHRPDMLAATARMHQAEATLALAQAQRKRDVTVGLQFEHYPPDAPRTFGFGISVPLFTGNNYSGEIARANADLDSATTQRDKVRIAADAEIAQAISDQQSAAEKYRRSNDQLLIQAHAAARMAETAYAQGASSLTDLLDARRELRNTENDAIDARADYANAEAELRAALTTTADHRAAAMSESGPLKTHSIELPDLP
jgi:cobalt-zinc-cadmium efflux system outer membrane protein